MKPIFIRKEETAIQKELKRQGFTGNKDMTVLQWPKEEVLRIHHLDNSPAQKRKDQIKYTEGISCVLQHEGMPRERSKEVALKIYEKFVKDKI